jgi:hypothetical protein
MLDSFCVSLYPQGSRSDRSEGCGCGCFAAVWCGSVWPDPLFMLRLATLGFAQAMVAIDDVAYPLLASILT